MISIQSVPDASIEDMPMYANIERSALMKVATRPEIFSCYEVIGWILPRADVTRMILANTEKKGYVAYNPTYIAMAYNLPSPQTYVIEGWFKELGLELVETMKKMMIPRKNFKTRPSGEYETSTLRTPYRFIALMLNIIFGRANGKSFNLGWILAIYYVVTQGTIFN